MTLLSESLARLLTLSELVEAHAHARTELVKVSDVIVKVLTEHLPADATATVDDTTYSVQRVTWPLVDAKNDPPYPHPFGSFAVLRDKVVLADIRTTIIKGSPTKARLVGGRNARLAPWPTGTARLHRDTQLTYDLPLATEDDLLTFANELPAVLDAFSSDISARRNEFREATQKLLRAIAQ